MYVGDGHMIGHKFTVTSLAELCQTVEKISDRKQIRPGYPLWFRGHDNATYFLLPSLLRLDRSSDAINSNATYDTINLQDDYRLQNFKARVFHLTNPMPSNRIEWQALYQHHFGATRLLDWSESVWTALSFALEAFLDPRKREDLKVLRSSVTPTIWVLDPVALNQKVFETFASVAEAEDLIRKAFNNLNFSSVETENLVRRIKNDMETEKPYHRACSSGEYNIATAGIMNLGMIDEYRQHHMAEMRGMLLSGEYNPFFYLCMRYYADALPVCVEQAENAIIPPLAVLHQYQSERIRSQRGTFTVFPNYYVTDAAKESTRLGYDCRRMENQPSAAECLYEIRLLNPRKIAKELTMLGGRQTELYPESDCYTRIMEAEQYSI